MTVRKIINDINSKYVDKNIFTTMSVANQKKYCRALVFPIQDLATEVRERLIIRISQLLRQREIFVDAEMVSSLAATNTTAEDIEAALILIVKLNIINEYKADLAAIEREAPNEILTSGIIDSLLAKMNDRSLAGSNFNGVGRGNFVAAEAEQTDYIFLSNREMILGKEQWATSFALANDGTEIAFVGYSGEILFWNTNLASSNKRIVTNKKSLLCVAFSLEGEVVAVGGDDGVIMFFSKMNGKLLCEVDTGLDTVYCITYSHSGKRLAVGGRGNRVCLFGIESGLPQQSSDFKTINLTNNYCWKMCFDEEDEYLLIAGAKGELTRYELFLDRQIAIDCDHSENIFALAVMQSLFMINGERGELLVKSVITGKRQLTRSYHGRAIVDIAISFDQELIATIDYSGSICIWDALDINMLQMINLEEGPIIHAAFELSGKRLVLLYKNGKVRFLELEAEEWHRVR
ncbi:MAG: hypothetical protein WCP79_10880 [Bacillota bacterium]